MITCKECITEKNYDQFYHTNHKVCKACISKNNRLKYQNRKKNEHIMDIPKKSKYSNKQPIVQNNPIELNSYEIRELQVLDLIDKYTNLVLYRKEIVANTEAALLRYKEELNVIKIKAEERKITEAKRKIEEDIVKNTKEQIDKMGEVNYYKEKKRLYHAARRKTDDLFKFSHSVRSLIYDSFKRNSKNFRKQRKTIELLGCTIPELCDHLAKQFKPGMSFENHGQWHIDHVIPLASATSQSEIERLCHYTNLQPLWAKDNITKGSKINIDTEP